MLERPPDLSINAGCFGALTAHSRLRQPVHHAGLVRFARLGVPEPVLGLLENRR